MVFTTWVIFSQANSICVFSSLSTPRFSLFTFPLRKKTSSFVVDLFQKTDSKASLLAIDVKEEEKERKEKERRKKKREEELRKGKKREKRKRKEKKS